MGNTSSLPVEHAIPQDVLDNIVEKTGADPEVVRKLHRSFTEGYPDGKIDQEALVRVMKVCFPDQDVDDLATRIFHLYDLDSTGVISLEECVITVIIMESGTCEEKFGQIFRFFDITNDGTISKQEFTTIAKLLCSWSKLKICGSDVDKLMLADIVRYGFKDMDTDKDSKITKEEFIRACHSQEGVTSMLTSAISQILNSTQLIPND